MQSCDKHLSCPSIHFTRVSPTFSSSKNLAPTPLPFSIARLLSRSFIHSKVRIVQPTHTTLQSRLDPIIHRCRARSSGTSLRITSVASGGGVDPITPSPSHSPRTFDTILSAAVTTSLSLSLPPSHIQSSSRDVSHRLRGTRSSTAIPSILRANTNRKATI